MNAALGMWSLVFGGLALPNLESPTGAPGGMVYQPPNIAEFRMQAAPSPSLQRPQLPSRGQGSIYRRRAPGPPLQNRTPGAQYGTPDMAGGPTVIQPGMQPGYPQPMMPLPPTNPAAAAESFPFNPPTELAPGPTAGPAGAGQLPGPYALPERARPTFTPAPAASVQRPAPAQRSAPRTPAQAVAPKPFSNYRRPRGVSPYMNLFRREDTFGEVDPYNQWVKPRVEQGLFNQQVGGQVYGLQGANRLQGMDIRTLGRATQNLQRSGTRPRFMNYGGYYPGLQR